MRLAAGLTKTTRPWASRPMIPSSAEASSSSCCRLERSSAASAALRSVTSVRRRRSPDAVAIHRPSRSPRAGPSYRQGGEPPPPAAGRPTSASALRIPHCLSVPRQVSRWRQVGEQPSPRLHGRPPKMRSACCGSASR
jgi:hypothetical protein